MTPELKELLFLIRQHRAFPDLLREVAGPEPREYRPGAGDRQYEDYIFRSGRRAQDDTWRSFLTDAAPDAGSIQTSRKEQS